MPKEKSKQIGQMISNMSDLIDRCLTIGKIDDRVITLKVERFDISRMLNRKIENTPEPLRFNTKIEPGLFLNTDQKLFEVILTNLIDNAEKYSDPDHPIVIESQISKNEKRPGVEIIVSNKPRDNIWPNPELLFQKYYRGTNALRQAGSGLGLFLSNKLAERLGGELSYVPNDHNVRFRLWLPA
jgi:signal transduction histidine kinase